MTDSDAENQSATYNIPQPLVRRVTANAAIAVFGVLSIAALILSFWVFGLIVIFFIAGTAVCLFWWLAYPPENARSRLQISPKAIRYLPGRVERRLTEPESVLALSAQTQEIILCHSLFQGIPDGVHLFARNADGTESELQSESIRYLTAEEAGQLAATISGAAGLQVRLLTRRRLTDGTVREDPWTPPAQGAKLRLVLVVTNAALPFAIGALTGYIFPKIAGAVTIGLALCLLQVIVSSITKRSVAKAAAGAAITFVVSGSAFALAYVLTAHSLGKL